MSAEVEREDGAVSGPHRARFIQAIQQLNDPRSYLAAARDGIGALGAARRWSSPTTRWSACIRVVTAAAAPDDQAPPAQAAGRASTSPAGGRSARRNA